MGWNVHDLLRLRHPGDLLGRCPVPAWVDPALSPAPWVVVRRAPIEGETIPVGVRGRCRTERFAGFIRASSVVECVSPEALASPEAWLPVVRREELPPMRALPVLHATLCGSGLRWGPVGSVGFELASGVPVTHRTSDLDLIVRLNDFPIPPATAQILLEIIHGTEVRVDLLLETFAGAIAFLEYVSGQSDVVLRSINGRCRIKRVGGARGGNF